MQPPCSVPSPRPLRLVRSPSDCTERKKMAAKRYKVVLLGEGRVGKTSILVRYIKNEYDDRQVSTLQASYLDKKLSVDNNNVQLSIWDTAGQERFHALGPIYYRDADGALLVYDITDEESFQKVKTWVKELRRIVGDDIDITIAGNKIDLHRNRKVTEADAVKYAQSVNATHFHTSAKLNKGLDDVFVDLSKRMLARGGSRSKKNKQSALIADDEPVAAPSYGPGSTTDATSRTRDGGRNTIQIVDDGRGSTGRGAATGGAAAAAGGGKKGGCC
ncbi:hypothetical protein B5M09_005444 [Aphanomyces astaci]|uniref:Ras-related protein Rab-21 n=1 Tax=Aphanomyces astaci TaxID=112090 RepID=A0A3R8D8X7_APHAT|nr:hypothetical protein B5M09_005444 [Aphanomyces astaci]